MNIFALLSLVSSILFLQVGVFVLYKNHRLIHYQLLAVLSFLFSIYAFSYFLFFGAETSEQVYLYDRIASVGWVFFPVLTTWFFIKLTGNSSRVIRYILYLFLVPLALFSFYQALTDLESVKLFYQYENNWYYTPYDHTLSYTLFVIYLIVSVLVVFFVLIGWFYMAESNREKYQARVLLVSLSLFFILSFLTNLVFPFVESHLIPAMAPVNALVLIGGIAYALLLIPSGAITSDIIYNLILQHVREFIFITDKNGTISSTNYFTLTHLKFNNYDFLKRSPSEIFSDYPRLEKAIKRLGSRSTSGEMLMDLITRDGQRIPVMLYIIRIKDRNKKLHGFVIIGQDYRQKLKLKEEVDQRLRTEKNLSQIRKELEMLVKKRTRELQDANMRLQQEVVERKNAEEQIKADLEEKAELVKEVHHRVKNNIQMIISLVNMLCNHPKIDEQASDKLREVAEKVRYISKIHEDFYSSPHLSNIPFSPYLKKSIGELYSHFGKSTDIVFKLNIADEVLDINQAIPLGIVFNELMINALRYAFSESNNNRHKNIINVSFFNHDHQYSLVISDNGDGLPMPFSIIKNKKVGFQLVNLLVKDHLKGKIYYDDDQGATFKVVFLKNN